MPEIAPCRMIKFRPPRSREVADAVWLGTLAMAPTAPRLRDPLPQARTLCLAAAMLVLVGAVALVSVAPLVTGSSMNGAAQANVGQAARNLSLGWEANEGQADPSVRFLSRGATSSVLLTASAIVLPSRLSGNVGQFCEHA